MKKFMFWLVLCSFVFSLAAISFAHSGRTDKYGGHHNRKTGGYHYHHRR
ncbi:MAG: YHYH domain-containing protein [Candidatus Margulisiibacteriota bacterium]